MAHKFFSTNHSTPFSTSRWKEWTFLDSEVPSLHLHIHTSYTRPTGIFGHSQDNANIWMDKWIEDTLLKPSLEEQVWKILGWWIVDFKEQPPQNDGIYSESRQNSQKNDKPCNDETLPEEFLPWIFLGRCVFCPHFFLTPTVTGRTKRCKFESGFTRWCRRPSNGVLPPRWHRWRPEPRGEFFHPGAAVSIRAVVFCWSPWYNAATLQGGSWTAS